MCTTVRSCAGSIVCSAFGLSGRRLASSQRRCLAPLRQAVRRPQRTCCKLAARAHNSLLLPDVTPDPRVVPPAVAASIMEYARSMPTWEVAARTGVEVALSLACAFVVVKMLQALTARAIQKHEQNLAKQQNTTVIRSVFRAALVALQQPVAALVPFLAAVHSIRVIALAGEVLLTVGGHRSVIKHRVFASFLSKLARFLQNTDCFTDKLLEVVIIQIIVWFFLNFKQQIMDLIMQSDQIDSDNPGKVGLERILLPISSLAGWIIVLAGALSSVQILGINVQPLLAVGGVSGIAIGFGAQSVSANAITGINLFVTRPFVVGDRVELRTSSGTSVVTGLVERIAPMSTTIRNDFNIPISIPNKAVGDMIVVNESRVDTSPVQATFKDPRQLTYKFGVRYEDADKVKKIAEDIKSWFNAHPGVDQKLPAKVSLADLGPYSLTLSVMVHTTPRQSRSFSSFKSELLTAILDIVDRNGAEMPYPTSSVAPPKPKPQAA